MTHCLQRPAGGNTALDQRGRRISEPDVLCLAYKVTADTCQWVPRSRAHLRANPDRCGSCTSRGKCKPPLVTG